jgi:hypothetical protein
MKKIRANFAEGGGDIAPSLRSRPLQETGRKTRKLEGVPKEFVSLQGCSRFV